VLGGAEAAAACAAPPHSCLGAAQQLKRWYALAAQQPGGRAAGPAQAGAPAAACSSRVAYVEVGRAHDTAGVCVKVLAAHRRRSRAAQLPEY